MYDHLCHNKKQIELKIENGILENHSFVYQLSKLKLFFSRKIGFKEAWICYQDINTLVRVLKCQIRENLLTV